ncbi:unnamed protein product [Plutella xylostella]|uniref:(diamondback moth) hypothetical protein n=1 Tax=Plutella xylostella TaxID=51655 RepID=A0A8S4EQS9_PLUXY|nr:unnamed protein product [Plutella xylostella]
MADKEQVISALRATLISVKGALTIKQCNRDFKELQGEWIPFKRLGYPSLEKLFQDVPGFKVKEINGEWYVDAIASQETQHIATMVAKQKSSKKTGPKLNYPSRFPKRQDSWRTPAALSGNYKSNYNNQYSNQYYRAKGPPPRTYGYNSNPSFNKYNKYSKPNETRNTNQYSKQVISRTVSDHSEVSHNNTAKNNSTTTAKKDTPPPPEQVKQPTKIEVEPVPKPTKVSASQRLSNLRDRLNTVDLIPLQLPSMTNECTENSGPVSTVAPAHSLEPPPDSTSSVEKLEWTCQKLGLPQPVFKVLDIRPKRGPVSYDCSVKVGNQYKATSYPDSAPSEEIAKEVAAVKLLASIESSQMGGLPTSSDSKALASLADLVAEHEAGLWASTVAHLYREKYGENLPNNWQELVENCPRIIKDRVVNGLLVLLPNNESPVAPSPADTTVLDDSIDSDLPPLQFPDDNYWNVFVTVANSTLEIWLRIIGVQYSDAFEALLADMGRHYDRYGTSVEKSMLINNAWYAVNLEDGGWQRAKILEIEEDRATVFLGDHGDDDVVSLDKIKILEPQFRKLPAQAILCRLEGAEELAASSQAGELVRARLQGEVLVAAPGPRDDPAEPAVSVVLYDTSTARDLNLNKEIIHDFCISGAFSITQVGSVLFCVFFCSAPGPRDDPAEPAVSVVLYDTSTARDLNLNKEIIHDFCISGAFTPGPRDDPAEPAVSVVLYDTSTARDLNLNKEIIHDFCISGAFSITQKACEVRVGCVTEEGRVWVSRAGGAALVRAALALLTAPGPYRRPCPPRRPRRRRRRPPRPRRST